MFRLTDQAFAQGEATDSVLAVFRRRRISSIVAVVVAIFAPAVAGAQDADPGAVAGGPVATAQPAAAWAFRLRADLALYQIRDDLLAPLRYAGPALGLRLAAERRTASAEDEAHLRFGFAGGLNRYRHGAFAVPISGSYTYLRPLRLAHDRATSSLLGIAGSARMDDMYFIQWDDAHLYWLTTYAIGPAARVRVPLSDDRALSFDAGVPVLGVVSRPPEERFNKVDRLVSPGTWFTQPHQNLSFATWPDLIGADLRIAYTRSASRRPARLVYDASFRTTPNPRRAVVLEQALGFEWTFGGR